MSSLVSFCDKVAYPVDQGKPGGVVFLDFHNVSNTVSYSILLN